MRSLSLLMILFNRTVRAHWSRGKRRGGGGEGEGEGECINVVGCDQFTPVSSHPLFLPPFYKLPSVDVSLHKWRLEQRPATRDHIYTVCV